MNQCTTYNEKLIEGIIDRMEVKYRYYYNKHKDHNFPTTSTVRTQIPPPTVSTAYATISPQLSRKTKKESVNFHTTTTTTTPLTPWTKSPFIKEEDNIFLRSRTRKTRDTDEDPGEEQDASPTDLKNDEGSLYGSN
ncbi:hypothetical protein SNEBB_006688 [Seison nebaliae]|nr:hypothetical protein SNEBB_006688 [Seison nebaliae]